MTVASAAEGHYVVANILPFVRAHDDAFDDETTRIMGEAFDAACALLSDPNYSTREAIADRIIDAAKHGERDPIRLRDAGLAAAKSQPH
jgi:hypothetical protein